MEQRGQRRQPARSPWAALALAVATFVAVSLVPLAAQEQGGTPVAGGPAPPAATPTASPPALGSPVVWTQLDRAGNLVARAVVAGPCPTLDLGGAAVPMAVRAGPAAPAFADTVCEAPIPASAGEARIAGRRLALLPPAVSRLAVVGDMGCRVDQWGPPQDCTDRRAWPATLVAAEVASWRPDLILHVGDYIYREAPCPPGAPACTGTPWGDNQGAWQADFFDPLAELLPTAPWLFLRGNHEICEREGAGWFRYLDPGPMPSACQPYTEPYALSVAGLPSLAVLDSAMTADTKTTPEVDAAYREQLRALTELAEPGTWLLTHKPLAGSVLWLDGKETVVDNATFRSLADNRLPTGIAVVVAGHIHLAEALLFDDDADRPTQLVVGNSGTRLDNGTTGAYDGALLGDPAIAAAFVAADFGWMRVELAADRAIATAVDLAGDPSFVVHLAKE